MTNVLYHKVLIPGREAPDGETNTTIHVTQENNCYAIWLTGYDYVYLLEIWSDKNKAIERGVELGKWRIDQLVRLNKIKQRWEKEWTQED